jgi:hypothetical protein
MRHSFSHNNTTSLLQKNISCGWLWRTITRTHCALCCYWFCCSSIKEDKRDSFFLLSHFVCGWLVYVIDWLPQCTLTIFTHTAQFGTVHHCWVMIQWWWWWIPMKNQNKKQIIQYNLHSFTPWFTAFAEKSFRTGKAHIWRKLQICVTPLLAKGCKFLSACLRTISKLFLSR